MCAVLGALFVFGWVATNWLAAQLLHSMPYTELGVRRDIDSIRPLSLGRPRALFGTQLIFDYVERQEETYSTGVSHA